MKTFGTCLALILLVSCSLNHDEKMIGNWVSVMERNIHLQVKRQGNRMAVRYSYPDFLIDTSGFDSQGKPVIHTPTAPHEEPWQEAYYDDERDIIGGNGFQISNDTDNHALVCIGTSNVIRVFGRVKQNNFPRK